MRSRSDRERRTESALGKDCAPPLRRTARGGHLLQRYPVLWCRLIVTQWGEGSCNGKMSRPGKQVRIVFRGSAFCQLRGGKRLGEGTFAAVGGTIAPGRPLSGCRNGWFSGLSWMLTHARHPAHAPPPTALTLEVCDVPMWVSISGAVLVPCANSRGCAPPPSFHERSRRSDLDLTN